ncbi:MAG TPA: hypothetical protein VN950_05125 [Terriglobales bacterium]|nr:hypothetical protein [Terriglobales bacterium]
MRLEKKEWLLLALATLFALAGLGPDDPWIVGPGLILSWIVFLALFFLHEGWKPVARLLAVLLMTAVLGGIAVRKFHFVKAETPTTPKQLPNQPEKGADASVPIQEQLRHLSDQIAQLRRAVGKREKQSDTPGLASDLKAASASQLNDILKSTTAGLLSWNQEWGNYEGNQGVLIVESTGWGYNYPPTAAQVEQRAARHDRFLREREEFRAKQRASNNAKQLIPLSRALKDEVVGRLHRLGDMTGLPDDKGAIDKFQSGDFSANDVNDAYEYFAELQRMFEQIAIKKQAPTSR